MKATILTFSKALNRGAMMQCYALQQVLQRKGYDVDFLDVRPHDKKLSIKGVLYVAMYNWKISAFCKQNGFCYTKKYGSYDELVNNPPKTDLLVIGSDQIWNNEYTYMYFDPRIYFGGFLHGVKKLVYAASFGKDTWYSTPYDDEIKKAAQELTAISVREESGINICKEVLNRQDAVCIVDPTLLLNKSDLQNLMGTKCKKVTRGHTYVYLLHKDKQIEKIATDTIDYLGCPSFGYYPKPGLASLLGITSISEWLSNINEAEHIVTNSFHCMVMCILLRKDFYVIPTFPGREIRMTSLMMKLDINNRYFSSFTDIAKQPSIDYTQVEKKLYILREESLSFINKNI